MHKSTKTMMLSIALGMLIFSTPAWAQGSVTDKVTKDKPGAANDLHYEFDRAITKVEVVDGNGNVVADPGPFPTTAGVGTQKIDFSGGVVNQNGTAPTQVGAPPAGERKYKFTTAGNQVPRIKKRWWTNANNPLPSSVDECLEDGLQLFNPGEICVRIDIPALSQWGLIALGTVILLAGTIIVLRRRQQGLSAQ